MKPRLLLALGAYLGLAALVWSTISNHTIRLLTWAFLALLAGRTLLLYRRRLREDGEQAAAASARGQESEIRAQGS